MSRSRSQGGPKQVVHYNSYNDPSGLHRLPQTEGIWKPIAYLGFIVMTVGLGVFGFVLVATLGATFGAGSGGGVPKMPAELPIGFGIALAGGLAFQLGIVLGAPAGEAPRGDPVLIDNSGDIIASDGGSITFGSYERNVTTYTLNQQLAGIDDLYDAVMRQRMDKRRRAAVVERLEDLNGAVEGRAGDKAIDQRLRRVTDVLYTAGALTGGATAVFASLLKLAGMLGTAGQGVYDWLNPQRR